MNASGEVKVLCHISELIEGTAKGFLENDAGQDALFIVKQAGELFAWRNACPHVNGAPMAWRKDAYMNAAKTYISCHAHGALFEINTGLCIQGPCLGQRLEKVPLEVNSTGEVLLTLANINNNKNKE